MRKQALAPIAVTALVSSSCVAAPSPPATVGYVVIVPDRDVFTVAAGGSVAITGQFDGGPVLTMTWAWDPAAIDVTDLECEPRRSCGMARIGAEGERTRAVVVCDGTHSVRGRISGKKPGRTRLELEVFGRRPCVMVDGHAITCGDRYSRLVDVDVLP